MSQRKRKESTWKRSHDSILFFQYFPACCCAFRSEIHDNDWITLPSLRTIVFGLYFFQEKTTKLRSKNYYLYIITFHSYFFIPVRHRYFNRNYSDSLNIHEKLINAIDYDGRLFIYIQKSFRLYYAFNLNFYRSTKYRCLKWLIVTKLNYSKI